MKISLQEETNGEYSASEINVRLKKDIVYDEPSEAPYYTACTFLIYIPCLIRMEKLYRKLVEEQAYA